MRRGFTLIELLIVVAIIAILAAIAVPNFLEAQTRSKVARVKADLRTITIAIEAYHVDNNKYPPDADDFNPPSSNWASYPRFIPLTTPIVFMTAVPFDPFIVVKQKADPYADMLFPGRPPYPYSYMTDDTYAENHGSPSSYGLVSVGPNNLFDSVARGGIDDYYDPTNGTISRGDVVRRGPGVSGN